MERRLAAVLAADVVGYSRHMRSDEAGTLAILNSHREEIIDPQAQRHNGRIVKLMGDGILMEFSSAVDAVGFAVEMQNAVTARNQNLPDEQNIVYRIGINVGDIIFEKGDIFGDGVNIAARLEGIADSGGICISGTVHDQVTGKLPQKLVFMGEKALKNIDDPVRAYSVVIDQIRTSGDKGSGKAALEFDPPDRPAIAILPFQSLGSDSDKDYIADGIRFGISATLVQLSGLFLVHAPVLNGYREKDIGAQAAGTELGVRYILEGAVQQAGSRIRVTVQLTDTEARRTIMAENFDRVLEDIFQMQDEITREIIYALNIKLVANEVDRVWFGKLTHPEAIESYYRGASHFYELNKDDNEIARQMFERLYQAQPESVVGPSYVAVTHWMDAFFDWTNNPSQSKELDAEWAQKAMEYEQNNGIGHAVYGHLKLVERKFDEALEICSKGTKLRSSCPLAHALLGLVLNFRGNADGAVKSVKEALQLEKVYPAWLIDILAAAYRDRGDIDLSIPAAAESIRLNPKNNDARLILCSDHIFNGNKDEAKQVADQIIAGDPEFSLTEYEKNLPYQNPAVLEKLITALREAGLPD
ncbi:MAG: adenylate/guanylate cyclase domain-containing protein [Rhizobiaceae bacterium]